MKPTRHLCQCHPHSHICCQTVEHSPTWPRLNETPEMANVGTPVVKAVLSSARPLPTHIPIQPLHQLTSPSLSLGQDLHASRIVFSEDVCQHDHGITAISVPLCHLQIIRISRNRLGNLLCSILKASLMSAKSPRSHLLQHKLPFLQRCCRFSIHILPAVRAGHKVEERVRGVHNGSTMLSSLVLFRHNHVISSSI